MELITTYANIPLEMHKGDGQGLLIVYPGLHYPPCYPLLYYARKAALSQGWDVLAMEYDLRVVPRGKRGVWLEEVAQTSLNWAAERAPKLALVGKSLGTAMLALAPVETLTIPWGRVWITPLVRRTTVRRALARETHGLAFAGSRDGYISAEAWQELAHPGLRQVWLEGADHRLEEDDPLASLQHLSRYAQELGEFLRLIA